MVSTIYGAAMTAVVVVACIGVLITYILKALGTMGCLKKAGEAEWKAWVPIYSDYTMYKVVGIKRGLIAIEAVYIVASIVYVCVTMSFMGGLMEDLDKTVDYSYSYSSSYNTRNNTSYSTRNNTSYSARNNTSYSTRNQNTNSYLNSYSNSSKKNKQEVPDIDVGSYIGKGIGFAIVEIVYIAVAIGLLVVNIFFAIYISKAYGLGGGYIAGMILVPTIFILIIGFGKSEYKGTYQSVKAQQ